MRREARVLGVAALLLLLTTALAQGPGVAGIGLFNQRSDPEASITSENAARLQQAWTYETEAMVTAMPIENQGRVYVTDWGGWAYALDAATGELLWQTKVVDPMTQWPWHGLAGTGALDPENGVFFVASVEGHLAALDTEDGVVLWETSITDQENAGNLSKLLYYDGLVYLGLQSVEEPLSAMRQDFQPNFQGRMKAFDAATGELVWERPLVTEPKNGVAVWSSFALDPQMNALFLTTGNNYTGEPSELSDSVIAVDASTGEIIWANQVTQQDVWTPAQPIGPDVDFGAGPQLFDAVIDGETRPLVGAGQKTGHYMAFDRETGELLWSTIVGLAGVGGGIRGEASVAEDRILVWSNNSWDDVGPDKNPADYPIDVEALDPATGAILWSQPKVQPAVGWSAGFLAGDAYFVGSLDGTINAFDAADGSIVWSTQVPGAVGSPLVVADDTLYVGYGVPAGFGGSGAGSGVIAYRTASQ